MAESNYCVECKTTKLTKFRLVAGFKWNEVEAYNLVRENWVKGIVLCSSCYMKFVENPLRRGVKRLKVTVEDDVEVIVRESVEAAMMNEVETLNRSVETLNEEEVSMIDLIEAITAMGRFFYEREYVKKEGPIYSFDEMRDAFQTNKVLKAFLDKLYFVAKPLERSEKTMDRTSNEGLDTMANLGVTTTSRAVDKRKKSASDAHEEYVENALLKFSDNAFRAKSNPCPILAIPCNGAFNPKFIDDELIMKHLDERFIINLGIPYHERVRGCIGECSDDELME
ncbi:17123_t:CDS:2 [Gigaspora margarita]|uniref:17123_t:CDS:1 n=1 Tax=Gigaspora margarita TaxID=4874 RepID=A0ABN7UUX5_GIGMA|nr:17123_t:CDS:2 [Gigaspora margarita]